MVEIREVEYKVASICISREKVLLFRKQGPKFQDTRQERREGRDTLSNYRMLNRTPESGSSLYCPNFCIVGYCMMSALVRL